MSEPGPKILANGSASLSFFQLDTETLDAESDTDEITLNESPAPPRASTPQPILDSDNDCACE